MWRTLAKFAVSATLIWFAFRNQDLGALWHQFINVNRWSLLLATAILAAMTVPLTLRWFVILRGMKEARDVRRLFGIVWIGLFFNQTLPSAMGGDVMRMWFGHKIGLPAAKAVTSIVIDRIYGLVALLLLVAAALPGLARLALDPAVKHGVVATIAVGFAAFAVIMMLDRMPKRLRHYQLIRGIADCARDIRSIFVRPRRLVPVLGFGLCAQLGTVLGVFVLAKGLGLEVGFLPCVLVVSLVGLILVAPISIAGWGVREGSFITGFGLLGVARPEALTLSILYGLLNMLIGLVGGIVWLSFDRLTEGDSPRQPAGT